MAIILETVLHLNFLADYFNFFLVLRLADDLATLRPTIFVSVPRIYNKIYDKITKETLFHSGIQGYFFRKAYQTKLENMKLGKGLHHSWLDSILFGKIASVLGGNVRVMITGSAPISPKILEFFRICFSAEFLEGYGATETCAMGTFGLPGDYVSTGDVGYTTIGGELKLESVPDMKYSTNDFPFPRGEILIRGPFVFQGYYKDAQKTAEVLSTDGWFHTGDIGVVNKQGKVSIIDRKKHIFKLAQGEYVAPEKLENIYGTHPEIAQIFVYGNPLESYLVAVIVPEMESLLDLMKNLSISSSSDIEQVLEHKDVKRHFVQILHEIAKANKLPK